MKVLAVIPARGGSKGIPRKNVQLLAGQPLVCYAITEALRAERIDRVVVSTDDDEIADIAKAAGSEVVARPNHLSGDLSSSESALLHTLKHLADAENYHPDLLVFLQCTAPLTLAEDMDATIQHLLDSDADSAFSANLFHYFIWRQNEEDGATGINHQPSVRPMRQEREAEYQENGAIYVMRTAGFLEHQHRFFGKTVIQLVPKERCLEIDEPIDLQIAELLIRERRFRQA